MASLNELLSSLCMAINLASMARMVASLDVEDEDDAAELEDEAGRLRLHDPEEALLLAHLKV
jgi:hypothetical protein